LGDGFKFGIELAMSFSPSPDGLAQPLFLVKHLSIMMMCVWYWVTRIFYGQGFTSKLKHVVENVKDGQGATVSVMRSKIQNALASGI